MVGATIQLPACQAAQCLGLFPQHPGGHSQGEVGKWLQSKEKREKHLLLMPLCPGTRGLPGISSSMVPLPSRSLGSSLVSVLPRGLRWEGGQGELQPVPQALPCLSAALSSAWLAPPEAIQAFHSCPAVPDRHGPTQGLLQLQAELPCSGSLTYHRVTVPPSL